MSQVVSKPLEATPAAEDSFRPCRGEVLYLFAYDLAYDMKRQPIERLLGQPVRQFAAGVSKRGPRTPFFYQPAMVALPDQTQTTRDGRTVVLRWAVKLFPVGAISVSVRVAFEVDRLEELASYHDLETDAGPLEQQVQTLADRVRQELLPYCIGPVDRLRNEEAYTVFRLDSDCCLGAQAQDASGWIAQNRRTVAAVLTQESDPASLSEQEIADSTANSISYYRSDAIVMDWDAALAIDSREGFDELAHIIELANVQLVELEAYDAILDMSIDRVYRDVARRRRMFGSPDVGQLREVRIDLARLSDELQNTTKFLGEWHLARVYQNLARLFHLGDWHTAIDQKLSTLNSVYSLLKQEQTNRLMVVLEATIVALFILDVVIMLWPGG